MTFDIDTLAPKDEEKYQKTRLAELFIKSFRARFDEAIAEHATSFSITKQEFDEWLVINGLITEKGKHYEKVPGLGTAKWTHFVQKRNSLRDQLNAASSIGQHGEPPYRIDAVAGAKKSERLTVQLLSGMVLVTHRDAVRAIQSLAESKMQSLAIYQTFFVDNQEKLPIELRQSLYHQQSLMQIAAETVASVMNSALERLKETYERGVAAVEADKRRALPAPEEVDS